MLHFEVELLTYLNGMYFHEHASREQDDVLKFPVSKIEICSPFSFQFVCCFICAPSSCACVMGCIFPFT